MTLTRKMADKTILALGADIKNRILLAKGKTLFFAEDLGDLTLAGNFSRFKKEVNWALKISRPDIIACDLHPNYVSSIFAQTIHHSPFAIQHHHAHIASVMQEHGLTGSVLGVSFDGSGFGNDGNSWGGEFLLVNKRGFKRLGQLKYQKMPGKDKVVFEPWRMVLSILGNKARPVLKTIKKKKQELIMHMLAKDINLALTSSAGRLFDAAAGLLGLCVNASHEAEGPMRLERICARTVKQHYPFQIEKKGGYLVIDPKPVFLGLLGDLKKGRAADVLSAKFHNSMTEIIVQTVRKLSLSSRAKKIVLSGGVFQNKILLKAAIKRLSSYGFKVFTNRHTPVNDLNISLGQYFILSNSA